MNQAIDYARAHLAEDLSLEVLARAACFSPYHFHRIFCGVVGETPADFVKRLRLDQAAFMLTFNPRKSITEVAFACGFSSSATFARAFKEQFGTSASEWRRSEAIPVNKQKSKNCKTDSKNWKDESPISSYLPSHMTTHTQEDEMRNVECKQMPAFHVAYIRRIGPYGPEIGAVFERIERWVDSRNLLNEDATILGISWDNPHITPPEKCRYDACVVVPETVKPDGEVGMQDIPAGRFACYRFTGNAFQEEWDWLIGTWLPQSGYQPASDLCYELYHKEPQQKDGQLIFDVSLCMEVEPL